MSEQSGELSEGDRLGPGGIVDEGDPTPYAEDANQAADGAPKNYGEDAPDANLPPADLTDDALDGRHDGVAPEEDLPPAMQ